MLVKFRLSWLFERVVKRIEHRTLTLHTLRVSSPDITFLFVRIERQRLLLCTLNRVQLDDSVFVIDLKWIFEVVIHLQTIIIPKSLAHQSTTTQTIACLYWPFKSTSSSYNLKLFY